MLPKVSLSDVDETSLSLSWANVKVGVNQTLKIQYKLPQQPWDECKSEDLNQDEEKLKALLADLEPGTPYCVRLIISGVNGDIVEVGPETVFDTAPINCTPKQRTCLIM